MKDWLIDKVLDTIEAIVQSNQVRHYMIGYTKQPMQSRSYPYEQDKWDDFVCLADCLTRQDALDLEEEIFNAVVQRDKRSLVYRKYEPYRREQRYFRSNGGSKEDDAHLKIHKVYMAWTHLQGNHD